MLLLNGTFNWFTKLPDIWQTLLVAAAIFIAGFTANAILDKYTQLPAGQEDLSERVIVLEDAQSSDSARLENIDKKLISMGETLKAVENGINILAWRVEIIACYQTEDNIINIRNCIANAQSALEENAPRNGA